jgi:transcriptional regulator with XRE-family HTH domain
MTTARTDAAATEHQLLGSRLRAAREYIGLSQELVAEHLGISRPAVSAMEHGTRKVSGLELKKLSRLYGRPVAYFLGEEDAVMEADEVSSALFRATLDLNENDRQQVLQFAEFLRNSGPAGKRP